MKFSPQQLRDAGFREYEKGVWSPAVPGRDPAAVPDVEPDLSHAPPREDGPEKADQVRLLSGNRVRIEVISYRSRFADADNLASKWFVDSLEAAGLIADDSPKWVESVTFRQVKCRRAEERTVLEVYPT